MQLKQPSFLIRNKSDFILPSTPQSPPIRRAIGHRNQISDFTTSRPQKQNSFDFRIEQQIFTERQRESHIGKVPFLRLSSISKDYLPKPFSQGLKHSARATNNLQHQYESIKQQVGSGRLTSRLYDRYMKPKKVVGRFNHQHLHREDIIKMKFSESNYIIVLYNYYLNSPDSREEKSKALQEIMIRVLSHPQHERYAHILRAITCLSEQRIE